MNRLHSLRLLLAILNERLDECRLEDFGRQDELERALAEVASQYLLSPALYPLLEQQAALPKFSSEFCEYLHELNRLNVQRNEQLLAQATEVRVALDRAGIPLIALKGLASLLVGLHASTGERVLGDLDLLLAEDDMEPAAEVLQQMGYVFAPSPGFDQETYDSMHQSPALIHPERRAAVELHRRLLWKPRPRKMVESLGSLEPQTVTRDGVAWQVPAPTLWLAHVMLHQMVQDVAYVSGKIHLRQMLDARQLVSQYGSQIDWAGLQAAAIASGCRAEWGALCVGLQKLFAVSVPCSLHTRRLGANWYWRAVAQLRWPLLEATMRWVYQFIGRWLPIQLRQRLGMTDYGWEKLEGR